MVQPIGIQDFIKVEPITIIRERRKRRLQRTSNKLLEYLIR